MSWLPGSEAETDLPRRLLPQILHLYHRELSLHPVRGGTPQREPRAGDR